MFKAIIYAIGNLWVTTHINCGQYQELQNIQRSIHESGYRDVEIATYSSYQELDIANNVPYTGDGLSRLFDSTSDPRRFQDIINTGRKAPDIDCDDYAAYNVVALNKSKELGVLHEDLARAYYMTIHWGYKKGIGFEGHVVALMMRNVNGKTMWSFMDYFYPSEPKATIKEVIDEVTEVYSYEKPLFLLSYQIFEVSSNTYGLTNIPVHYFNDYY